MITTDDGCPIYVEVTGSDSAPALLLSNSLGTNLHMWDDQAGEFAKQLEGKVAYEHCGDLDTATRRAREAGLASACASPTVLLSPACASFDQFNNFEHRGDTFRDIVEAMRVDHPGGHIHLAKSAEGLPS